MEYGSLAEWFAAQQAVGCRIWVVRLHVGAELFTYTPVDVSEPKAARTAVDTWAEVTKGDPATIDMAYVFDACSPTDLMPDSKPVAWFRGPHVTLAMMGLTPGSTLGEDD